MIKALLLAALSLPVAAFASDIGVTDGPGGWVRDGWYIGTSNPATDVVVFGRISTLPGSNLDSSQPDFDLVQSNGAIFQTYTTEGGFVQWTTVISAGARGSISTSTATDNAILGPGSAGHYDLSIDGSLLARPNVEIAIALFVDGVEFARIDRRLGGAPALLSSFTNFSTVPSFTDFTSIRFLQVAESDYFVYGENAGTPGGHFTVFFEGVDFPGTVRCWECGYAGSANHDYEIRAKNSTADQWTELRENAVGADVSDFAHVAFSDASNLYYREFSIPENYLDFVDSGITEINFHHPQDGTTAHRFRMDKLELAGRFSYTSIAFTTNGDFPEGTTFDLRVASNQAGEEIGIKSLRLHGSRTSQ